MKHTTPPTKQIRRPESEQILVKNTYAPLVSRRNSGRSFRRCAESLDVKHMEEPNLFSGLAYCSDCRKYSMYSCRTEKMREDQYYFRCFTYGKAEKGRLHTAPNP